MKRGVFFLFIVVSIIQLQISKAQTLPQSHLLAAYQLIKVTGVTESRFNNMRSTTIKILSEQIPDKKREKFSSDLTVFLNKYLPKNAFEGKVLDLYTRNFSEQEINQLIDFYSSPLGKKMVTVLPEIIQKCNLMDQQILNDHKVELQNLVEQSTEQ